MTTPPGGPATHDAPPAARLARMLASPLGVLILVPMLVIAAGITVMLLGRRATTAATDQMARRQLAAQASDVQHDLEFALDQAAPLLDRLRGLADPALPLAEVATRMRDLTIGRPGVVNVSIGFPSGVMRGTFIPPHAPGELQIQESIIAEHGTVRTNYQLVDGGVAATETRTTDYDVRLRPHYALAVQTRRRTWTAPRVYFTSKTTGLTCVEPVYAADGSLRAVITVDFDVAALSQSIVRSALAGSRAVVFAGDGTILAYPAAPVPAAAIAEGRLLRHDDYGDPVLSSLIAQARGQTIRALTYASLGEGAGAYLVSIAPVAGRRAGVATPLDWYLAALVPETTLLGPTRRLEKQSLVASGGALLVAVGIALLLAWNLVRMRRDVRSARARARSAEARVRELGSYRLVSRIGVGGMGEVWRAEHRLLARQAAVKLVRPDALADPLYRSQARERFRREAQTLASMKSRHTIALFDYGVTEAGTFFYVMELLDGLDLDRLVREQGPQPAARVIHLLVQACQSLGEAHEAGLLHRDIKPANIFLCRAADEVDLAKVLDFGIVQTLGEQTMDPLDIVSLPAPAAGLAPTTKLTQAGAVIGTPGYIPPEQTTGRPIDARSDLYQLGCVAWWLLTGSEVFARPDDNAAIHSHVHEPVPPLRPRVAGWLPANLEAIVLDLLAKDPDDRTATARALAAALRAIEIPAEHAWTEACAQAWWAVHRPVSTAPDATAATREQPLLVTGVAESDAGPEAATLAQRPRGHR